ncbi:MAG: globin [Planctomycetota bacterium]|jgi:hemoglobin|nr:MAG: globin [Planctomycetota bacterium]
MTDSASHETPLTEGQIYDAIGSDGIARLVHAFYQQIPQDDVLGPMYPPHDLPGAEERLRLFLLFRFGGPQDYLQRRGHPMLRGRHAPFSINQTARDRWVQLMDNALEQCRFSLQVSTVIRSFLAQVATFLINQ